jgi:hypothetical protein
MARADDFARFILRRGRIGRAKVIDTRVVIADVTRRPGP